MSTRKPMMPSPPLSAAITGVLFDLDGTLLDTAPDMVRALNRLRLEQGESVLPFATIRPVVSHGAAGLIELGFGISADEPGFAGLRERFLELYQAALAMDTTLFAGMEGLLARLEADAMPWGIVTNKPGWLTTPLLRALNLWDRTACVVSGDTLSQRKPHPAPLFHACSLMGIDPTGCIYVGDARPDVEAGNRAGMTTLVACFGYIGAHETPANWGAAGLLATPEDLLPWLEKPILPSAAGDCS